MAAPNPIQSTSQTYDLARREICEVAFGGDQEAQRRVARICHLGVTMIHGYIRLGISDVQVYYETIDGRNEIAAMLEQLGCQVCGKQRVANDKPP